MQTNAMQQKTISIFGVASCLGAQDQGCRISPYNLLNSGLIASLHAQGIPAQWQQIMSLDNTRANNLAGLYQNLAEQVQTAISKNTPFIVIGGDHSCAIGTWSGAALGLQQFDKNAELGLIWVDAHMDAHTPESSPSGALHGMPVACLLGHGEEHYCNIGFPGVKIKPENICLIGIRSYEKEEAELLRLAGVQVYFIEDINQHGVDNIMQQALAHICQRTTGFGISIDLDSIDPIDAPGVGSPEENGILGKDLLPALSKILTCTSLHKSKFLGAEITELNPEHDIDQKTQTLVADIIHSIFGDK